VLECRNRIVSDEWSTHEWRRQSSVRNRIGCGSQSGQNPEAPMSFEILGEIVAVETIASGRGIRERARLQKQYGRGRWRKRKGFADVCLTGGEIVRAEVHWYEATGIGKREFKIKRFL
jgi:hypothetical protein